MKMETNNVKLTDDEIITALGRLSCKTLNDCKLINAAIDLINRLQAENDDLKRNDLPRCKYALRRANEMGIALEKEKQELKAEVERLKKCIVILKDEACKRERRYDPSEEIDNLLKEMGVEGE